MPLPNEPVFLLFSENALLLEVLLVFTSVTLLVFTGFILGGSAVAFLFPVLGGRTFQPFGLDLLARIVVNPLVAALLALVAAISLYCAKLLYDPALMTAAFWGGVLSLLFIGLAVLALPRRLSLSRGMVSPGDALLAALGSLPVLVSLYVLISAAALLIMPEEWPFVAGNWSLILSWNGVAGFLQFIFLSLAVTGAGILGISARADKGDLQDAEISRIARKTGTVLTSLALLLWPLPLLFDLVTLPVMARSSGVFILAGVSLVMALLACLQLLASSAGTESRRAIPVMTAVFVLLFVHVLADHLARGNALVESVLLSRMPEVAPVQAEEGAEPASGDAEEPVSAGKGVFEQHCTACHRFDRRVVGPPLNEVVPKYQEDIEALKNFIRTPVKKNPDYPAMPKLALSEDDIAAVAAYILEQAASENGG